jgi:hypothetical protein
VNYRHAELPPTPAAIAGGFVDITGALTMSSLLSACVILSLWHSQHSLLHHSVASFSGRPLSWIPSVLPWVSSPVILWQIQNTLQLLRQWLEPFSDILSDCSIDMVKGSGSSFESFFYVVPSQKESVVLWGIGVHQILECLILSSSHSFALFSVVALCCCSFTLQVVKARVLGIGEDCLYTR